METLDPRKIDKHVALVQRGDGDAYRYVVNQLIGHVRAFVVARSLPGVDVDEIVQQSFIEAFTSIGDYEVGTDFVAWLLTIARYQLLRETARLRRAADYHRKYVPVALAKESEQQLNESASVEHSRLQLLQQCLDGLPPSARRVLALRYEQGDSISQMAESLDRSAGAIRKQLCLLRKQLHECITRRIAQEQR